MLDLRAEGILGINSLVQNVISNSNVPSNKTLKYKQIPKFLGALF